MNPERQGPVGSLNSNAMILLSLTKKYAYNGEHIKNLVDHMTKIKSQTDKKNKYNTRGCGANQCIAYWAYLYKARSALIRPG